MAVRTVTLDVLHVAPVRVDGLCPTCHLPGLWRVTVVCATRTGLMPPATRLMCHDCRTVHRPEET